MFEKEKRYSFRKGLPKKVFSTPFFSVRYDLSESSTVGVVVSKKVSKKAVIRNKIKRRILKVLREHMNTYGSRSIVVYARQAILNLEDDDLEMAIVNTLQKLK